MKAIDRWREGNKGTDEIPSSEEVAEHLFEDLGMDLPLMGNRGMVFFKPTMKFIKWIRDYADDRMIIEVGCGTGLVLRMLQSIGYTHLMGMDPAFDYMAEHLQALEAGRNPLQILPYSIERGAKMLSDIFKPKPAQPGYAEWTQKGALLLCCRPCHSGFLEQAIDAVCSGTEVMYITKPSVLEDYQDLGKYQPLAQLTPHEGESADGEVVMTFHKPEQL